MTMEWDERSAAGQQHSGLHPAPAKTKVTGEISFQMMALELENLRLTKLVAELLMKNQQLREKVAAV